jgi:hypothetical protein
VVGSACASPSDCCSGDCEERNCAATCTAP